MILGLSTGQFLEYARSAKQQSGTSIISQMIDVARLRMSDGGVTADYYYNYRLFEPKFTWHEKKSYVGPWAKTRIYRIQDQETARIFSDKFLSYRHFHEKGWPYPNVLAATHVENGFADIEPLNSEGALRNWLNDESHYPFFCKPSVSYLGYGSMLIVRAENGQLILGNGSTVSIDSFVSKHGSNNSPTMLFQELIRPHPALEQVIGNRVATARIVVLNGTSQPKILAAGLRIPSGNSMTDNFQSGKSGNMIAFIDLETGRIRKVLNGLGIKWSEASTHPDTGQPLKDLQIPNWSDAVELVLKASRDIAGLKLHGWDVAFSDKGPLLVETNPRGDLNIAQLSPGQGLLANQDFLELYPNRKF